MSTPGEESIVGAADHHSEAHKQEKETHKQAIEKAKEAYKQAEKQAKEAYEEAVEAEKRAQEQRHREHKAQERAEKERREVAKYLRKHPNVTANVTTHHGGNSSHHWTNDTLGLQEIQYPVGGSLSLEALPQAAQPHSSLSTVGGVAIAAALGFVAFKVVKKYRRRSSYQQISETTPLI